jgi:hypothetical protein
MAVDLCNMSSIPTAQLGGVDEAICVRCHFAAILGKAGTIATAGRRAA